MAADYRDYDMPKRTNDFQRLIAMLAELLGEGAVVEESRMLTELDSDHQREVDVCIEGTFAGHHTLIGIECRDHDRKQDVSFVESMHAKHSHLPTDILILASSSGFTKLAVERAKKANIRAITPSQVTDKLANDIAAELGIRFSLMIRRPTSTFSASIPQAWRGRNARPLNDIGGGNYQFFRADGSALVTAHEYEAAVLSDRIADCVERSLQPEPITILVDNPEFNGGRLHAGWTADGAKEPALLPVDQFTIVLTVTNADSVDMSLTSKGMFGDIPFYTGTSTTTVGGKPARFVVADTPTGRLIQVNFEIDVGRADS
jgi:hypothetical protein